MEKNNGKIAIAIVAMFVVALSIVGFTYAYFVATVTGNDKVNVEVTAGILEVEYTTTKNIAAKNLAPGWMSDGLHYFDSSVYETDEATGEVRYTSQVATEGAIPEGVDENDGITEPAEFKVAATERNTGDAKYVIILNGITNTLDAADKVNFTYALCEDSCAGKEYSALTDGDVVSKGQFGKAGENADATVQVISDVQTLGVGAEQVYELMLYYANIDGTQSSTGRTVSADVEVVGVTQDANGNWIDANGVTVIAA